MTAPTKPVFGKPALPVPDIIAHPRAKGLTIADEPAAAEALRRIGYYRLLIYMRPL
jgi:abortive infection bacteriophage resistance protein